MGKYSPSKTRAKKKADEMERTYKSSTAKKRKSKKKSQSGRAAGIVVIFIALVAIIVSLGAGYIYYSEVMLNGIILENIKVAGVDVGGMTQKEAISAVEAATVGTYSKIPMVITVMDDTASIPTSHVGTLNVRAAVKAAYQFGNTGSTAKREEEQNIAMTTGYIVDITPYLDLNTTAIKDILYDLGANYSTTLTQSTYEVTGEAPNQVLTIHLGVPEYGLDLDDLYETVMDAYNRNVFEAEGICGMIKPESIDLQTILDKYYIAPVNAIIDAVTHEILPGKEGYGFDLETAQAKLAQASYGSTITIPFTAIEPTITANKLTSMLFRDELSTYTATAESESNRNTNLELACQAIDGIILYPGDVFSYNNALGERTSAKGYKPGPSFSGNETVYTIGGGICQVSSSLYYCAMIADLEILVRTNHRFSPAYAPLGMDATVSWGSLDFRFRNTSDYPIRIEATANGGETTVRFVGTDVKDYYVEMETVIINTDPHTISYQTYNENNTDGYKDGEYIVEPYTGYQVKTYRCKYNKETKELLSKDLEAESSYRRRDGIICKISDSNEETQPDQSTGIGGGIITDEGGALPPE